MSLFAMQARFGGSPSIGRFVIPTGTLIEKGRKFSSRQPVVLIAGVSAVTPEHERSPKAIKHQAREKARDMMLSVTSRRQSVEQRPGPIRNPGVGGFQRLVFLIPNLVSGTDDA